MSTMTAATIDMARQERLMRSGAHWFIWIGLLSLANSFLFAAGSDWGFFIGLGVTQLADAVGKDVITGSNGMVLALVFGVIMSGIFLGLAWLAQKGLQWGFIVGMALFALDALLILWAGDWLGLAFHGLALYFLFKGLMAARLLATMRVAAELPAGTVPPITPR
jgi:hypothetical protein